jgi:polysaccharide biosynthesis transport protein
MSEQSQASDADAPAINFNPTEILFRRWPFLILGLIIGGGIAALHFISSPNVYQSSAQLLVIKKRTDVVQGSDVRVGVLEDYVQTQLTVVTSQKIRQAAARLLPVNRLNRKLPDAGQNQEAYAAQISSGLTAARDKNSAPGQVGSGVMVLSFRGSDGEDTKTFLEAVIQAYENELSGIYEQTTRDRLNVLQKAIESSKNRRAESEKFRQAKQDELRGITTEELNSIRSRVTSSRNQLDTLKLDQLDMTDQLDLIGKAGKNRKERLTVFAQLTSANRTGGMSGPDPLSADLPLRQLLAKKKEMEQELGAKHPTIRQLDAQISFYQEEIQRQNPDSSNGSFDELEGYLQRLTQRKKTVDRQIEQIQLRLNEDEKKVLEGGRLQDRIDSLKQVVDQEEREERRLESERQSLEATQGSGGYSTNQLTPPGFGAQVGPILYQSALLGLVAGMLLGAGLMMMVELADKSFHSPAEIRRRLGCPVLGHVPQIRLDLPPEPNTPSNLDPTLVAALRPKSGEAEAYRGLRTQLFFSFQGKTGIVMQVTSPNPGDGKSTLAANLAISIAQSGKRVILVDCDLRKPRVHKLFHLPAADHGLATLLATGGPLAKALISTQVEGLNLLPCGPKPSNPAELLTSPQFNQLLADLRHSYDVVILDTPPLLAVSDPAIVSPRVDGVIMTFRMSRWARPNAERARETIVGVGGKLIGVVVNAWSGTRRAYEGYNYGSGGYSYSDYSYSDDYSDK